MSHQKRTDKVVVKRHSKADPAYGKAPHQSVVGLEDHSENQKGAEYPIENILYGDPDHAVGNDPSEDPQQVIDHHKPLP